MNLIGKNAKKASLEKVKTKVKNNVLKKYVSLLNKEKNSILKANAKDIKFALKKGLKKKTFLGLKKKFFFLGPSFSILFG